MICPNCGKEFIQKYVVQKYCSKTCMKKVNNSSMTIEQKQRKAIKDKDRQQRIKGELRVYMRNYKKNKKNEYNETLLKEGYSALDVDIINLKRKKSVIHIHICSSCGKVKVSRKKQINSRCIECNTGTTGYKFEPTKRICKECGCAYEGKGRSSLCNTCYDKHQKTFRRIQRVRRKAFERNVKSENVNPIKVFERDNWTCKLCGIKTPKSKRGLNELNSPELDHIIPISKGGPHVYTNVQCLCRSCNMKKSDKLIGQLILMM